MKFVDLKHDAAMVCTRPICGQTARLFSVFKSAQEQLV